MRGMRVDEAINRMDDWLNDAALEDVSPLRVIHSKGTGVLRRAIRDYLGGHSLVSSWDPGEGPGGDGVTVVALK